MTAETLAAVLLVLALVCWTAAFTAVVALLHLHSTIYRPARPVSAGRIARNSRDAHTERDSQ